VIDRSRGVIAALLLALVAIPLTSPAPAHAQTWGSFKKDHCTFIGKRQDSAVLHGIAWGKAWEAACAARELQRGQLRGDRTAGPARL